MGVSYGRTTGNNVLNLTTYWQVQSKPTVNYTIFAHLLDPSGKVVAQRDAVPSGWSLTDPLGLTLAGKSLPRPNEQSLPTTTWTPGESLLVNETLPLPAGVNLNKNYRLIVGAYSVDGSGKINLLPVSCTNPSAASGNTISLSPVGD